MTLRDEVHTLVREGDDAGLEELVAANRRAVRYLLGMTYQDDREIRGRAARAIGIAGRHHAKLVQEVIRRLIWAMNDESATNAENAVRNALNEPVTWENHEELVQKAVESGVITEEQATTVRLAQKAARSVIEVDEFTREEIEGYANPAFRPAAKSA